VAHDRAPRLAALGVIPADDMPPGLADSEAWFHFVEHVAETLDIGPGTRVYQVACGRGAFLQPLYDNGYVVGGLDASEPLIREARAGMPMGQWSVGDAASLDPGDPWDVVVAVGAFASFPDLDYARGILARMAAKATHAVAVLDVPDLDRRGPAPVAGLWYDRGWMLRALAEIGASAVQMEEQRIEGYEPAHTRFNVFARL
jgi:cyclopropane fatty-acyl-phospholipid synthase-like methyltransferase